METAGGPGRASRRGSPRSRGRREYRGIRHGARPGPARRCLAEILRAYFQRLAPPMTPSELPQVVLARILTLQNHVGRISLDADAAERARDHQRSALASRRPISMHEKFDLGAEQKKLEAFTLNAA